MENKYDTLRPQQYNRIVNFLESKVPIKENYRILEVGCNTGYNLERLKKIYPNCYTVGVDILDIKQPDYIDEYFMMDIEKEGMFFDENFDIILCADILEHLTKPHEIIQILKGFLKDDGYLIASIPNIMYYSVLYDMIMKGNFTYTDTGLLDYDHKHFFTFNEIERMFEKAGFSTEVYNLDFSPTDFNGEHFIHELQRLSPLPSWFFTSFEYYVLARKLN